LPEHGTVSRGICSVNDQSEMVGIKEITKVYFNKEHFAAYEDEGNETIIHNDTRVSMNFWGFTPAVFEEAKKLFKQFVDENENDPKSEFFIPAIADSLLLIKTISLLQRLKSPN
jgi:hypothetical protein